MSFTQINNTCINDTILVQICYATNERKLMKCHDFSDFNLNEIAFQGNRKL